MSSPSTSDSRLYAVIPAGGSGTRLWPLSRSQRPKFLLDLGDGGPSLIQQTAARLAELAAPADTFVVTGAAHAAEVARQLPAVPADNVVVEPAPRDSAPAIGLAAAIIARRDPAAIMGSFAADHLVADEAGFHTAIRTAMSAARAGRLVTVGMTPTGPETGFGYLRRGEPLGGGAYEVAEFTEKPPLEVAERYLADGRYLWNACWFVWPVATFLAELARQCPQLHDGLVRIAADWDGPRRDQTLGEIWPQLPRGPVDTVVMEGAAARGLVAIVPADVGWTDVGDWDTLAAIRPADADGVARVGGGPTVALDSPGTLIAATSGRLVATVGVRDLVVVDTPDAVLVCRRDQAQAVKALVERVKAEHPELT